jgi:transposase
MSAPFKSSPVEFNQHLLFPSNIFDLLSDGHECYLFADLFQQLDTATIESGYSVKGQNAYHPRLIVAILIYAYSRGVFSSRQIERRCREDLSFMYSAQMNCPNFRVLSDFRKSHGAFFQDCFKQTVKLALALKLASLGHISLDGSKPVLSEAEGFKANSSKHKAMSYGRLKEKEQALSAEIDALIEQASRCDREEGQAYQERTGYEIPEDLKHKQDRLAQIKAAKQALEHQQ